MCYLYIYVDRICFPMCWFGVYGTKMHQKSPNLLYGPWSQTPALDSGLCIPLLGRLAVKVCLQNPGLAFLVLDTWLWTTNFGLRPGGHYWLPGQVLLVGFWSYDWDLTIAIALVSTMIINIINIVTINIAIAGRHVHNGFFLGRALLLGFWTYDWDLNIAIALTSTM